jgi:3-mercaptopyruvate sulfurtransferase SseA
MHRSVFVIAAVMVTALTANAQLKITGGAPGKPGAPAQITTPAEAPLESARRIERDEAIKLVKSKKAVYIDVRTKESYDAGHIKGAINIPLATLNDHLKDLPRGKMLITYCA